MNPFQINRPPPISPEAALRRRAFVVRCVVLVVVLTVGGGGLALLGVRDIGLQLLLVGLVSGIVIEEVTLWSGRRKLARKRAEQFPDDVMT
jgi:hypothetical protein